MNRRRRVAGGFSCFVCPSLNCALVLTGHFSPHVLQSVSKAGYFALFESSKIYPAMNTEKFLLETNISSLSFEKCAIKKLGWPLPVLNIAQKLNVKGMNIPGPLIRRLLQEQLDVNPQAYWSRAATGIDLR